MGAGTGPLGSGAFHLMFVVFESTNPQQKVDVPGTRPVIYQSFVKELQRVLGGAGAWEVDDDGKGGIIRVNGYLSHDNSVDLNRSINGVLKGIRGNVKFNSTGLQAHVTENDGPLTSRAKSRKRSGPNLDDRGWCAPVEKKR